MNSNNHNQNKNNNNKNLPTNLAQAPTTGKEASAAHVFRGHSPAAFFQLQQQQQQQTFKMFEPPPSQSARMNNMQPQQQPRPRIPMQMYKANTMKIPSELMQPFYPYIMAQSNNVKSVINEKIVVACSTVLP